MSRVVSSQNETRVEFWLESNLSRLQHCNFLCWLKIHYFRTSVPEMQGSDDFRNAFQAKPFWLWWDTFTWITFHFLVESEPLWNLSCCSPNCAWNGIPKSSGRCSHQSQRSPRPPMSPSPWFLSWRKGQDNPQLEVTPGHVGCQHFRLDLLNMVAKNVGRLPQMRAWNSTGCPGSTWWIGQEQPSYRDCNGL